MRGTERASGAPWLALLVLAAAFGGIAGSPAAMSAVPHPASAPTTLLASSSPVHPPRVAEATPTSVPTLTPASGLAAPARAPPVAPGPDASGNIGQVLTTISVGPDPLGVTADPSTGDVYVSNYDSNTVSILRGTSVIATVGVPTEPVGGVYDPASGDVLISCWDGVVTSISGTTVGASVSVGADPYAGAYDAQDGETYIPNYGSANVTILPGTGAATSVSLGKGTGPVAAVYDPSDEDVYVADDQASEVSVLYGSTLVATIPVGTYPGGLAYDAANQEVYVANSGSQNFTVIDGTSVAGNYALPEPVWWAAYDSEDQDVYFTGFEGSDNITAVSGTSVLGSLEVGTNPLGADFEPTNGVLYVSSSTFGEVAVVSTGLFLGPASISPNGVPANTTDLGETFYLDAPVNGNTTWSYQGWANVSSPGLDCQAGAINVTSFGGGLGTGEFNATCTPFATGNYTVDVTVNATGRISVVTAIDISVNPRLVMGLPVASYGKRSNLSSTDVGVHIGWNLSVSGGSGEYSTISWVGFPIGSCAGEDTSAPACTFTSPTSFSVSVSVTDTDGESAQSGSRSFSIVPLPTVETPLSNRSASDVGQLTGFNTTAMGGSGGYTYHWVGVPLGCASTLVPTLSCAPTAPGIFSVSVYVNDTNGGDSATSSPVFIDVFSDPNVPPPVATPAKVSTGEEFTVSINITGGPGDDILTWYGLPSGGACYYINPTTSVEYCTTSVAGTYEIRVDCTDANGFTTVSPTLAVVVEQGVVNVGHGNNSGNGNTFLGLPAAEGYTVLALGIIVLVSIVAALAYRAGSRPPEGASEDEVGPDDGGRPPADTPSEEEAAPEEELETAEEGNLSPVDGGEAEADEGAGEEPLGEDGEPEPAADDGEGTDDGASDQPGSAEGAEEAPRSRWWRRSDG